MNIRTLLLLTTALSSGGVVFAQAGDPQANWEEYCARCHAKDGSGETKPGRKLKLQDYRDPAVQATFSDEEMIQLMVDGITNKRGKQEMPSYTEKMTMEEMQALVPYVRSLASPGS